MAVRSQPRLTTASAETQSREKQPQPECVFIACWRVTAPENRTARQGGHAVNVLAAFISDKPPPLVESRVFMYASGGRALAVAVALLSCWTAEGPHRSLLVVRELMCRRRLFGLLSLCRHGDRAAT